MKRSFKFLSFWLFIALSTATVVFTSYSKGDAGSSQQATNSSTSEKGVVINGVRWATRNIAAPGTFAAKPEDAGKFYQWNRKKAWATTGDVMGWDSSYSVSAPWPKVNDPSPAGWRIPTADDFEKLLDTDKVRNVWTTQNGVNGRKFTDTITGNSIFLPAVGSRDGDNSTLDDAGARGLYWSCDMMCYDDEDDDVICAAIIQFFGSDNAENVLFNPLSSGLSIRAVSEN